MNTDEGPEPAKPDKMETVIGSTRLELVYSNEKTERHLIPTDHPHIPHHADETCWCRPELVHNTKRWAIYRHRRQQ